MLKKRFSNAIACHLILLGFITALNPTFGDNGDAIPEEIHPITPGDFPNKGIMLVDNESRNRSGHAGQTLVECHNGDILAFFSNVDPDEHQGGHGTGGWTEYMRSSDGGETWSEPNIIGHSLQVWENGGGAQSSLVTSVIAAPDGTLIATLVNFHAPGWLRRAAPVYLLSHDHGHTWSRPQQFLQGGGVADIAYTHDASMVMNDEVFVMFSSSNYQSHRNYHLYVSSNNGETFEKRSTLPFARGDYYGNGAVLEGDRLICVFYLGTADEQRMHYTISDDAGYTWSDPTTAFMEKAIRNPQMSDKINGYYYLHGRSGSISGRSYLANRFVLYRSTNGIDWDSGVYLTGFNSLGDSYSANTIVGRHDPERAERLLIQASVGYDGRRVNISHWWLGDDPAPFVVDGEHVRRYRSDAFLNYWGYWFDQNKRIHTEHWPWVYLESFGWVYVAMESGHRAWLYDLQLDKWLYTDLRSVPVLAGTAFGEFYFVDFARSNDRDRWIYSYQEEDWIY